MTMTSPTTALGDGGAARPSKSVEHIRTIRGLQRRNDALTAENTRLRREIAALRATKQEQANG